MPDRNKLLRALLIICGILLLVSLLTKFSRQNSMTLEDYAKENPEIAYMKKAEETPATPSADFATSVSDAETAAASNIAEASNSAEVNTPKPQEAAQDSFYYEPLSENLKRYITGISYPDAETAKEPAITYDDLSYLHILHYDFDGNIAEGELICHNGIAQDLLEIFYELYLNEYQLEKVRLIDEYDGNDIASMEDNNTSCFNYRVVEGTGSLSKHALGLAIDINPLYNPYITYERDDTGSITGENILPVSAAAYADRDTGFPYKIDQNDLCYKLFTEHGFTWGGNWNSCKDYQHFQKTLP